MSTIPIIDFESYSLDRDGPADLNKLGTELCNAFEEIGFCYLKNHGISEQVISHAFNSSLKFFLQPVKEKEKFSRSLNYNHGWVALEREKLNPERKVGDYKEAYNVTPEDHEIKWPSHIPEFKSSIQTLFEKCTNLSQRIFDVMSVGLKLKEENFLRDCHRSIGTPKNQTSLRTLFYPALPDDYEIKKDQVRCGEHSDYGTLTLLFQDSCGGLEVRNCQNQYIPATPIPGTIVVNIGDLMQRWTADKLKATKHRVLIPQEELKKRQNRQSIAFFVHPDDNIMIECLDKSNKYEPISSLDYLNQRFSATY